MARRKAVLSESMRRQSSCDHRYRRMTGDEVQSALQNWREVADEYPPGFGEHAWLEAYVCVSCGYGYILEVVGSVGVEPGHGPRAHMVGDTVVWVD